MQDTKNVEVDMSDYLDIMSDVNEVDAETKNISYVELGEERSIPQMSTAKGRADGFATSSNSRKG